MTTEQSFFLAVLRDYLHGAETAIPAALDWDTVCQDAHRQMLEGIVYAQCRRGLEQRPELAGFRSRLAEAFGQTVVRSEQFFGENRRIRSALRRAGIPFLPVKGPEAAAFYPDPVLRTMTDLDFLVRAADWKPIRTVLLAAGFSLRQAEPDEWIYTRGPVCAELQSVLLRADEDDVPERITWFNDFWSHTEETPEGRRLDPNFHFLYLAAHSAKHIRGRGVGFRQFYDMAMLIQNGRAVFSWETIEKDAARIGLLPFLGTCMTLCVRWFGIDPPIAPRELPEKTVEEITKRVFRGGVFGFSDSANHIGLLERNRAASGLPLPLVKLKTSVALLFPPYRQLITAEKYSDLRGRPWRLPLVWLRRLAAGAGDRSKTDLVTVVLSASAEDVESRNRQLKEWGL